MRCEGPQEERGDGCGLESQLSEQCFRIVDLLGIFGKQDEMQLSHRRHELEEWGEQGRGQLFSVGACNLGCSGFELLGEVARVAFDLGETR